MGQGQRSFTRAFSRRVSFFAVAMLCIVAWCGPGQSSAPTVADRTGDGIITAYCLGDSNTDPGGQHVQKWCELTAAAFPSWKFINGGFARTKAIGDCFLCGKTLLAAALSSTPIDLVMIALGTNDRDQPPEAAVDALLALRDQADQLHIVTLVATIPPVYAAGADATWITTANQLLTKRVAPNRLIDFFTGMERADFDPDGIHIRESGQRKRADAAVRALRNL